MAGNKRTEYQLAIQIAGEISKSFPQSMKLTKSELRAISREAARSSGNMKTSFRQSLQDTKPMFDKIGKAAKKAFKVVTTAAAAASVGIGAFSIKTGMEFDSQMSTVKALSGASQSEMRQLNATAKELGATTKWTAKESGQAMEYMAMAGWDTKQMIAAVPATMNLASASGEELATVSDIVTDSMTAFNMKAKEAVHFTDVLAAAATNSNTDVGKLGESFKYAAPLAGTMKYSVEDTAIALGLMANSGIKASQAGTSVRSWLTRMAKPTKESATAMKALGIKLKDSKGNMKSFRTVIDETRESLKKIKGKDKQMKYAGMLAGKTGMSGLLAVVNATDKDYKKLSKSIDECKGAAEEMANTKLDNLEGDVTLFKSALDGAGLEIYNELKEPLRELVSDGTKWVGGFAKSFKEKFPTIKRNIAQVGEAVSVLATPVLKLGGWLVSHPHVITGTLTSIGAAFATHKIASGITGAVSGIKSLVSGFSALSLASKSFFIGTAAVTAIAGVCAAVKSYNNAMKEQSLAETFGDIALSMDDIKIAAAKIVGARKLERVRELLSVKKESIGFADSLKEANQRLNMLDWKFSIGMKMTETDVSDYESNIKQFVDSAQKLVDRKGYEVNVAASVLFSKDSQEYESVIKNNNSFFSKLDGEVAELSGKIEKKLKKGVKEGFTPDLREEINGLLQQISEATKTVTEAENDAKWDLLNAKWSGKDLNADSYKNLKEELQKNVKEVENGADEAFTTLATSINQQYKSGQIDKKTYEKEMQQAKEARSETIQKAKDKGQEFLYNTAMDTYGKKIQNNQYMSDGDISAAKEIFQGVKEMNPTSQLGVNADTISFGLDKIGGRWGEIANISDMFEQFFSGGEEGTFKTLRKKSKDIINTHFSSGKKFKSPYEEKIELQTTLEVNEINIEGIQADTRRAADGIKRELSTVSKGSIPIEIPVTFVGDTSKIDIKNGNKGGKNKTQKVKKRAKGGFITKPEFSLLAEAGFPEVVIPLDGSPNAYRLLYRTMEILGIKNNAAGFTGMSQSIMSYSSDSGNKRTAGNNRQTEPPVVIQYSPNIVINGDADESRIKNALQDDYARFERFMKRYKKENGRVSLA